MKVNSTFTITLPNDEEIVMTAKELMKFHDELTKFVNDNYELLTKDNED